MKQFILAGIIAISLSACGGAGDRTYDKPTVTDSVNNNRSGTTQQQTNDSTPTSVNNAYNTDSTKAGSSATGATGSGTSGQGSEGGSVKGGIGSGTSGNQANTKDKSNEKGNRH